MLQFILLRMLRIILKLWPAFLPIFVYLFWVFLVEKLLLQKIFLKKSEIKGEKLVGESSTEKRNPKIFSLKNHRFVLVVYASLILAILTLVRLGISG
ncbi:MAG: hypothetical protein KGP29_00650 [Proteobacteria bacterium]|nr:hypothetical protein [Pseudomonadota bacterium]